MRIMYDSVTPSAIPTNAALVAGYINGPFAWTAAEWARFPHSVKVRISVRSTTNDGHVCDCETGDLTPKQAVQWVVMRRKAGADPTVYCNNSTWPTVQAAFRSAGVAQSHYWIARYDGSAVIPAGAVAKQYNDPPKSGGNYDISAVADYWPGVDPAPAPLPSPQKEVDVQFTDPIPETNKPGTVGFLMRDYLRGMAGSNSAGPMAQDISTTTSTVTALTTALKTVTDLLAAKNGLSATDVYNSVTQALQENTVKVDVQVSGNPPTANPTAPQN